MADPTQTQRATESPAENGTPERPHPLQAAFNAAIADPDNVALQLAYARAAESAGKYEAAFPVYERVLALDPNNRALLQVKVGDVENAAQVFATLMGDVVEPRRDFIVGNALKVANLDV